MFVKLDEDISVSLARLLRENGYTVATVCEQGWGGFRDSELWPRVQQERAFLITADKGFADIRVYPPGTHSGVLVLRPARESLLEYLELLERVLANHRLEVFAGAVAVANPLGVRARRK